MLAVVVKLRLHLPRSRADRRRHCEPNLGNCFLVKPDKSEKINEIHIRTEYRPAYYQQKTARGGVFQGVRINCFSSVVGDCYFEGVRGDCSRGVR